MRGRKAGIILILISVILFLTGCTLFVGSNKSNDENNNSNNSGNPGSVEKIDYKFNVSNLPYDSTGLTIYVQLASQEYETVIEEIGKITSVATDVVIEKTLKLPKEFDLMYLFFVDDDTDEARYYVKLAPNTNFYKSENACWDVDGFYYYYYESTYNPKDPYAATDETHLQSLTFGTKYNFDASERPYLLFKVETAVDKQLLIETEADSGCDIYLSEDKDKLMTYKADKLTSSTYKCKSQNVYIMLRPKEYKFSADIQQPKCSITVTDLSLELKKCLRIEKAIVASNGKIYANGSTNSNNGKSELFCIDPANDMTKTRIVNMTDEIYFIGEVEPGIIYISSKDKCISKINIATNEVTALTTSFPQSPKNIIMHNNGKLVVFANEDGASAWYIYFVDKDTCEYKEIEGYSWGIRDLQYYPEKDIFFYDRAGSPMDINFLKIDNSNTNNPVYYTCDTKYHGDYSLKYPIKIFKTEPLQFLSPSGHIFNVNLNLIESNDYTADDFSSKIQNWCVYDSQLEISCMDFCIVGDYIYYLVYQSYAKEIVVKKCALANPDTVLESGSYEGEEAINLYKSGNKLYLLSNSQKTIVAGESHYKVFFHEIDF